MKRKALSYILAAVMVIGMIPFTVLPASAGTAEFKGVTIDYGSALSNVVSEDLVLTFGKGANALVLDGDVIADILVVGGGGAGGTIKSSTYTSWAGGGGGGAGEFAENNDVTLSAGEYTIIVGEGGAKSDSNSVAANGESGKPSTILFNNDVFIVACGGGGGGGQAAGLDGGSGGGSCAGSTAMESGGASIKTAGGFGNVGGGSIKRYGGGGGGAGSAGEAGVTNIAGNGGAGRQSDITGILTWYAAGGGGGTTFSGKTPGAGGSEIGGNGSGVAKDDFAGDGADGTGSGGGGGSRYSVGGAGGSGTVIIRIKDVPVVDDGKIHVKTDAELTEALAIGGEIVLDNDIKATEFTMANDAPEVMLDLNGKTLTVETAMMTVVSIGTGTHFTLKDSSAEQTGVWNLVSTRASGSAPQMAWIGSAVDILGGTVRMSNSYADTGTVSGFTMRNLGPSVYLNVSGGKIEKMTGTAEGVSLKAYTATVSGGEIEDFDSSGSWKISGGVFGKKPENTMIVTGCKILENTPVEGKWTVVSPNEITNGTSLDDKDTNNGYITTDAQKACAGDTVTVAIFPDTGYVLKALKYNDGEDHTVTADDQGVYKFTMPDSAVTVSAEFDIPQIHDNIIFTPWSETDSLPDTPGSYFLTEDVTLSETWNVPAGETNLCLNGCAIIITDWVSAVYAGEGVTLNLFDCNSETVHNGYLDESGLWYLGTPQNGETVKNIAGGIITSTAENKADMGGCNAVVVENGGSFTMNGGTFAGIAQDGAGVYVESYGTFTMNGGTIAYNKGFSNGAVCVMCGCEFTMNGGTIAYNTGERGGGVYIDLDSDFTMNGGTIAHNTAESGGGVFIAMDSGFTMNGGSITANTAIEGGGLYVEEAPARINGGEITANTADYDGAGITVGWGSVVTFSGKTVVKGNTKDGKPADIINYDSSLILENPEQGMCIGLCDGVVVGGANAGDEEYFFAATYGKYVKYNENSLMVADIMTWNNGASEKDGCIFDVPLKASGFSDYIEAADGFELVFSTESPITGTVVTVLKDGAIQCVFTVVIRGDVAADGVCDVLDLVECERTVNGHTELEGAYFMAADCDGDTAITADDYSAMVNLALAE